MSDELEIKPILPREWRDGEIEMFANGLIRYRTMTRAEVEKQFPKSPDKALEKG